jgi:hypothetical protein
MLGMGQRSARLSAAFALISVLACSSLGVCWAQFFRHASDCCQKESASAPVRPCSSAAAQAAPVHLAPPAPITVAASVGVWPAPTEMPVAVFAQALPVKSPPSVLRI